MKRTLLYFLPVLAFIAVILAACELNKNKPGKIIFDRVPFVYATINGQRELFLIDTGASTSMLDKKLCDEVKIYYMATGLEVIGVDGTSIPLKTTGRIPFTLDSIPYSASFAVQDMTSLRRATGKNVRGLIGSDVLGFYRLTVDFKTCELR